MGNRLVSMEPSPTDSTEDVVTCSVCYKLKITVHGTRFANTDKASIRTHAQLLIAC